MISSRCNAFRFFSSKKKSGVLRYVKQQMTDEYANRAREHSYRARSAFKLLEIDDRFKIFAPDSVVVDVGAAPGSWSQVAVERCGLRRHDSSGFGYLLGIDLQVMLPIPGADLLSQSDITHSSTQSEIRKRLKGREVDVLMSDMAPNPTGDSATDHLRLLSLCRLVLQLTTPQPDATVPQKEDSPKPTVLLKKDAVFLCKIWDGLHRKEFMDELRRRFRNVRTIKPQACRDNSAELYLLATSRQLK